MKARIKATGTIVEVEGLFDVGTALVNGRYFKVSELDFFDNFETIDWEQRRYELAKAAMQGYRRSKKQESESRNGDSSYSGKARSRNGFKSQQHALYM